MATMKREHFRRLKRIFLCTCDRDPKKRVAVLDKACREDAALRAEVESLLRQHDDPASPLSVHAIDYAKFPGITTLAADANKVRGDDRPERIGAYRIIAELDRGGMGVVYEVEQENPRRTVALKLIRPGVTSDTMLRRFQQESEALARLQHPGIAQVFEAGWTKGRAGQQPFFAMEYIKGIPLTVYADKHKLDTRQRLELFAKVCDAIHHAHDKHVIHRDLKPDNILVDETGQPKILDFGVARLTDENAPRATHHTRAGELVGTLRYMSPEQCQGDPNALDARSDVYALGVIFYELLVGRLPYDLEKKNPLEISRIIIEEDPLSLGTVDRGYRGDIDTITGKALEKDKARRYQTAEELASEIRSYLNHKPIEARPPSALYRSWMFSKRNKVWVSAFVLVLSALVTGAGVSIDFAIDENRARGEAEHALDELKIVVDFQGRMLRDIVPREFARSVIDKLRDRVKHYAQDDEWSPKEVEQFLAVLDSSLAKLNYADYGRDLLDENILSWASDTIENDFRGQPRIEAALRNTLGVLYRDFGLYKEAGLHLNRAAELGRQLYGVEHEDTLLYLRNLAHLLSTAYYEDNVAAEQIFIEMREHGRDILTDIDKMRLTAGVAGMYRRDKRLEEAAHLLEEALEMCRVLGDQCPKHFFLQTLADLHSCHGRESEAASLFEKAVAHVRAELAPENHERLSFEKALAARILYKGRAEEAVQLLEVVLEIQRHQYGEFHGETLATKVNLAEAYRVHGQYDRAESLYKQAIEGWRRMFGEDHMILFSTRAAQLRFYKEVGEHDDLEEQYRDFIENWRNIVKLPSIAGVMFDFAWFYESHQRYAKAADVYKEIVEILQKNLGPTHPGTYYPVERVAIMHFLQGQYHEATSFLEPLLPMCIDSEGEGKAITRLVRTGLGMCYARMERHDEAAEQYERVLDVASELNLEKDSLIVSSMAALADVYEVQHKTLEALELHEDVLEIRRRDSGEEDFGTLDSMNSVARLSYHEGRYDAAKSLCEKAIASARRVLPDERRWRLGVYLGTYGRCLTALQQFDEAEGALLEAQEILANATNVIDIDNRIALVRRALVELREHRKEPEAEVD